MAHLPVGGGGGVGIWYICIIIFYDTQINEVFKQSSVPLIGVGIKDQSRNIKNLKVPSDFPIRYGPKTLKNT